MSHHILKSMKLRRPHMGSHPQIVGEEQKEEEDLSIEGMWAFIIYPRME
jgi:hypothetical protein